ncbi:MAG TPA: 2OG-Fe(II) oxygenase [Candidatus Paceibacterota bacterium]
MRKFNNQTLRKILGKKYDENFFSDGSGKLGRELDKKGILVLPDFLSNKALRALQKESVSLKKRAYRSESVYNLYVLPEDKKSAADSPRNRKFTTTKGCIADDQIPRDSILRKIYDAPLFRAFICRLQGLEAVFPYADTLSSININYYDPGDSLEWHFDNADFAVTLLLKNCEKGGVYEYVPNVRYTPKGEEDSATLTKILDGKLEPKRVAMEAGSLMIFRGNRSLHRVTPVESGERVLVTLNYNVKPGIPLSEKSRKTFFGRTK